MCATGTLRAAGFGLILACSGSPNGSSEADLPALPAPMEEVAAASRGAEKPIREVTVALVGEVRGEIEPCGCPTLPYGGFARRERLLDQLRAEGQPLFHLDAGELLLKGVTTEARSTARTDLLLKLEQTVGVDVWVPGPTDLLALGVDKLASLKGGLGETAVISATWTDAQGAAILPPVAVLRRGGVTLGVVGLSGTPADRVSRAAVHSLDPVAAAQAAIQTLPADVDLVVALGSLSDAEADRIAAGVPGLAAVFSTRGSAYDEPRTPSPGGPPVIEAPDRGRYVNTVRMRLGSTADQPLLLEPEARVWRDLAGLQRVTDADPTATARRDALVSRFAAVGLGRNLATVEALPLGSQLDGTAKVDASVDAFKDKVVAEAARVANAPVAPHTAAYTSNGTCVSCHTAEFGRWAFTPHARAWEGLVNRKRSYDPECVGCHTTGYGKPGGLGALTPANLRRWKGVQCESCHGPMAGHPDDARVVSPPVTAATCIGCHDAANSPSFDFSSYLPRATCQGGAPDKGEMPVVTRPGDPHGTPVAPAPAPGKP